MLQNMLPHFMDHSEMQLDLQLIQEKQIKKLILNLELPEDQINRDVWKTKRANENGIYVIRLVQEEVYKNKIEWLEENLLPELVKRESNLFISSEEDIYDNHISLLSEDHL